MSKGKVVLSLYHNSINIRKNPGKFCCNVKSVTEKKGKGVITDPSDSVRKRRRVEAIL
jgi:hypothetical protein